jgi:Tfp pilus assembly protein PilF
MNRLFRPLIIALLAAPATPYAAADMSQPSDPVLQRAQDAGARQDWPAAQAALKEALSSDPGNADYHNLYAYSVRKGANPDMNLVFKHYNEALRIDPKHRGAHEYIGEAYLMVGNLPKAKEHLATLDKLCFLPCSEYSDLKKAVAAYESKQATR